MAKYMRETPSWTGTDGGGPFDSSSEAAVKGRAHDDAMAAKARHPAAKLGFVPCSETRALHLACHRCRAILRLCKGGQSAHPRRRICFGKSGHSRDACLLACSDRRGFRFFHCADASSRRPAHELNQGQPPAEYFSSDCHWRLTDCHWRLSAAQPEPNSLATHIRSAGSEEPSAAPILRPECGPN